jgi:hypothetical protein
MPSSRALRPGLKSRPIPAFHATARADARTVALDGAGHWWMLQDAARAATVLRKFWATLA